MNTNQPSLIDNITIRVDEKNIFGGPTWTNHEAHYPWNHQIKTAVDYISTGTYHNAEFNTTDNYQLYILGFTKKAYVSERYNHAPQRGFYCYKKDLSAIIQPWLIKHGYDENLIESELSPEDPYAAQAEHIAKFAPPFTDKTAKRITEILCSSLPPKGQS